MRAGACYFGVQPEFLMSNLKSKGRLDIRCRTVISLAINLQEAWVILNTKQTLGSRQIIVTKVYLAHYQIMFNCFIDQQNRILLIMTNK